MSRRTFQNMMGKAEGDPPVRGRMLKRVEEEAQRRSDELVQQHLLQLNTMSYDTFCRGLDDIQEWYEDEIDRIYNETRG